MSEEPAYRSELETLRAENERLRTEIAKLQETTDETIDAHGRMPLAAWSAPCRLCGVNFACGADKSKYTTTMSFETAYNPTWLMRLFGRTAHPSRVKRKCRYCDGSYYEMPAEKKFQ